MLRFCHIQLYQNTRLKNWSQKITKNNFRSIFCKQCKRKLLGKKYISHFSFCTIKFLYISLIIIHQQNKYLLSLRRVRGLHVKTNSMKLKLMVITWRWWINIRNM